MLNYLLIVCYGIVVGTLIFTVGTCAQILYEQCKEDRNKYEQYQMQN